MVPVKIKIINLGKVEKEFRDIIGFYERRISSLAHVKFSKEKIPDGAIILDEHGEVMDSDDFLNLILNYGKNGREIVFAIGPPNGFPKELKEKHRMISLSKMTLRHEIAYLILLEQIYRAILRIRGTSYHR